MLWWWENQDKGMWFAVHVCREHDNETMEPGEALETILYFLIALGQLRKILANRIIPSN